MKTAWAATWRVTLFFLAWGVLAAPFFVVAKGQIESWNETNPVLMRLSGDSWAVLSLLLATWLMTRFVDHQPLRTAGVTIVGLPRHLAGGLAIGATWLALPLGFAWVAGWIAPLDHGAFPLAAMPLAALATIVNVVAQQLLLCGYIFAAIRTRAGLIAAVIVSSILFCAYHAPAFQGHWLPALNVVFAATLFCLAREISGGIWVPVGIHTAWNFLLGPVLGLTVSGTDELGEGWRAFQLNGPAWATGGEFGIEGSAPGTVTTLLLIVPLIIALKRRDTQAGVAPSGQA
ncbi:MAG TPA: CPBP family intramembrane glutamic endopeptidase [Opitutaceae bacterium]|nr:CPBP family intramembrane glutamic endopeptidase [Opitutaceae bacterium]